MKKNYTDYEKIEFYKHKIRSLEAKIASERREKDRSPDYPTTRLEEKIDELYKLIAELKR